MKKTWKLAGVLMLALPLFSCSPEADEGGESSPVEGVNLENGDEPGTVQQAITKEACKDDIRHTWNHDGISIKIYRGNSACNVYSNSWNGTYTGIMWECVEFARRYWQHRWGRNFGSVGVAKDICTLFSTPQKFFPGDNIPKRKGDMMVVKANCGGTGSAGHVGIVQSKAGPGEFYIWDQGDSITDGNPNKFHNDCVRCYIRAPNNDNPDL